MRSVSQSHYVPLTCETSHTIPLHKVTSSWLVRRPIQSHYTKWRPPDLWDVPYNTKITKWRYTKWRPPDIWEVPYNHTTHMYLTEAVYQYRRCTACLQGRAVKHLWRKLFQFNTWVLWCKYMSWILYYCHTKGLGKATVSKKIQTYPSGHRYILRVSFFIIRAYGDHYL